MTEQELMDVAIAQARKSLAEGGIPIGSALARDGKLLAVGHNKRVQESDPVTHAEPANSGPGQIYPSIVDAPAAGCWRVQASWNGNTATLELNYS